MSDTILKKKKLLLFILEILKRYSDEENPLTIATIEKLLLKKLKRMRMLTLRFVCSLEMTMAEQKVQKQKRIN